MNQVMHSKESIHQHLKEIMHELFELDRDQIQLDAKLQDLDIDSIDAVDMMVKLKEFTQKRMMPDDFKHVRTVGDIVNAVDKLVNESAAQ